MIVAMVPMRVMKTAVNGVIDMVSMRNRLVAAAWAVTVSITANLGCAFDGVGTADVDDVRVDLSVTGMMQAAVMKVVNVVAVADCNMFAVADAEDIGGKTLKAATFMAKGDDNHHTPSLRYLALLQEGARAHGLPGHYIRFLEEIEHGDKLWAQELGR